MSRHSYRQSNDNAGYGNDNNDNAGLGSSSLEGVDMAIYNKYNKYSIHTSISKDEAHPYKTYNRLSQDERNPIHSTNKHTDSNTKHANITQLTTSTQETNS